MRHYAVSLEKLFEKTEEWVKYEMRFEALAFGFKRAKINQN